MPRIDVIIPYLPDKQLGKAYNQAMKTATEYVIFLDHDVLLINPHWYEICLNAITKLGKTLGFATCVTNRIAGQAQKIEGLKNTSDIVYHAHVAADRHHKFFGQIKEADVSTPFSGLFMLTHKEAWEKVGGFSDGFLGVDNDYFYRVKKAGYKTVVLQDLYVYHHYARFWKTRRYY